MTKYKIIANNNSTFNHQETVSYLQFSYKYKTNRILMFSGGYSYGRKERSRPPLAVVLAATAETKWFTSCLRPPSTLSATPIAKSWIRHWEGAILSRPLIYIGFRPWSMELSQIRNFHIGTPMLVFEANR
jgi:hypothetical protein